MTHYIIYFTEKKMYLRSSKLLIHWRRAQRNIPLPPQPAVPPETAAFRKSRLK